MSPSTPMAIVLMGVSGAGKTTVGHALAEKLGYPFYDADHYHSPGNVAKMRHGTPLGDDDRLPWLLRLRGLIQEHLDRGESLILACSALSERYRKLLAGDLPEVFFIYLKGDYDLVLSRLRGRSGHFMRESQLQDQFGTLEEPSNALVVSIDRSITEIVDQILAALR